MPPGHDDDTRDNHPIQGQAVAEKPPHDEAGTNRVGGAGGKPSFSQFGHWAWMNRALSDAGWRYYCAVRSYIFDADEEFEVDITDEVVAELLGKSAKSIGRARKDCYAAGVIVELSTWKESVRVEGKARPEVRTFRRLIVHHEVPEGYTGPVNAYREKRRIEQRRTQEQREARERRAQDRKAQKATGAVCDRTDVSAQSDQGERQNDGVCDRTNLSQSGTNLSEVGTNLSENTTSDQAKQLPYLPYHLPSHQPTNVADVPTSPEPVQTESSGWLDQEHDQNQDGERLLRSLPLGIGDRLAGHAVTKWSPVVTDALKAGLAESVVIDKLTSGLAAEPVASRVRIVAARRLPDLKATVEQAPRRAAERERSVTEKAHAQVDKWIELGQPGAQRAAGVLGEYFDPEPYRGNTGAHEWLINILPRVSREYVEQRRTELVAALTSRIAA